MPEYHVQTREVIHRQHTVEAASPDDAAQKVRDHPNAGVTDEWSGQVEVVGDPAPVPPEGEGL